MEDSENQMKWAIYWLLSTQKFPRFSCCILYAMFFVLHDCPCHIIVTLEIIISFSFSGMIIFLRHKQLLHKNDDENFLNSLCSMVIELSVTLPYSPLHCRFPCNWFNFKAQHCYLPSLRLQVALLRFFNPQPNAHCCCDL